VTDWKDRLRAFDDAGPDEDVFDRARQGPRRPEPPAGPSPGRRLTAGITALAVFALAAAFAWNVLRSIDSPGPGGAIPTSPPDPATTNATYEDPLGWKVDYPSNWIATPIDAETGRVSFRGATISNVQLTAPSPNAATPTPGPLPDVATAPPEAVFISIAHRDGGPAPDVTRDDSRFPLSRDDYQVAPGVSSPYFFVSFRGNGMDSTASVFVGADASKADARAMDLLIASIRFPKLRYGQESNGWLSLGPAEDYPDGRGTSAWAGDELQVVYVMRGPAGTYVLDLQPDTCGEGQDQRWDPDRLEILIVCPNGPDVRYGRYGTPVAGNPSEFDQTLAVHPVITSWDGSLLVNVQTTVGGVAEQDWP
jgi:hypothetical protein